MALIDGPSRLSKHLESDNDFFWIFPIPYIKERPYLHKFLKSNGHIDPAPQSPPKADRVIRCGPTA